MNIKHSFLNRHKKPKILTAGLALAVVIPAIVIPAPVNVEAEGKFQFKDVPKTHIYYDVIHEMREKNVIHGYEDGTFRPTQKISRQHAALLINNMVELKANVPLKQYNDIPKSYMYYDDIMTIQRTGLIKADGKGNFNPDQSLTRGEMALLIANGFNLTAKGTHPFKDLSKTSDVGKAVSALYEAGVTKGYEDGTFKENEPLSRAHYTLFLNAALKYQDKKQNEVTPPVEMSMDMTLEEYALAVKSNELFDLDMDVPINEWTRQSFNDPRQKRILIEGQEFVKQTNFQFKSAFGHITLEEPNHVSNLNGGFMATSISFIRKNTGDIDFAIDFTDEVAVNLTREFFKLAYPELDVDQIIYERAKEAREAYAIEKDVPVNKRQFRGNSSFVYQNGYKIKIGTSQFMNFFWIEVYKE